MSRKSILSKLVGVLLSIVVMGGGLIYAGENKRGFFWLLGLSLWGLISLYFVCAEWVETIWLPLFLNLIWLIAFLVMLVDSYRLRGAAVWYRWSGLVVIMLLLSLLYHKGLRQLYGAYRIPTNAMYPSVHGVIDGKTGDCVMLIKSKILSGDFRRGDIVAFDTSGIEMLMQHNRRMGVMEAQVYMKRIAGLPGETIQIDPPHLIINGQRVTSPDIFRKQSVQEGGYPGYVSGTSYLVMPEESLTLGQDEYFMLGDNSPNSLDSRAWGVVKRDAIIGKITKRYWPLSRFGKVE
ncbi:MAG: signal peptidase I [Verrucomicrobiota bacterium]